MPSGLPGSTSPIVVHQYSAANIVTLVETFLVVIQFKIAVFMIVRGHYILICVNLATIVTTFVASL